MVVGSRSRIARLLGIVLLITLLPQPEVSSAGAVGSQCERTKRGFVCLYGPVDVGYGSNELDQPIAAPPAGFITYARAVVVDEKGDRVPRHLVHLHHSLFFNSTEESRTCFGVNEGFYGTGKEHTRMALPDGLGYWWSSRSPDGSSLDESAEPWELDADLQGMHEGADATAYIRLTLRMKPQEAAFDHAQPLWWSAKGCDPDTTFDVKKGSGKNGRFKISARYRMPYDGRFVFGWGHVHDGGIRMVLKNVTKERRIFTSRALYGSDRRWDLTGTTTFTSARGVRANDGDVLRLTAVYDSRHEWLDAMGNLRSFIVLD